MKFEEFGREYGKLCFAFDKEVSQGQMLVYFEALSALPIDPMSRAVKQIVKESKFFPRVAEIMETIRHLPPLPDMSLKQIGEGDQEPVPMPEEVKAMIRGMADSLCANKKERKKENVNTKEDQDDRLRGVRE